MSKLKKPVSFETTFGVYIVMSCSAKVVRDAFTAA